MKTFHFHLLKVPGHTGSGKSVRMKDLVGRRGSKPARPGTLLLTFFFNARGAPTERSPEALFRTLLHRLLEESATARFSLPMTFLKKQARELTATWNVVELANLLHDQALCLAPQNVELIIDALDECPQDDVIDVVRRFEQTMKNWKEPNALHICWSSRFYPDVTLDSHIGVEISINDQNHRDIERYVLDKFVVLAPDELEELETRICERSNGIFFWAQLVVDKLIKLRRLGHDPQQRQVNATFGYELGR